MVVLVFSRTAPARVARRCGNGAQSRPLALRTQLHSGKIAVEGLAVPASARRAARVAVELGARRRLVEPDLADCDVGAAVALGAHRRSEHAAQHRELAHVRQRVGDRPLEDLRQRPALRRAARELGVERAEAVEEPLQRR
jgi:glutathione S-transferase